MRIGISINEEFKNYLYGRQTKFSYRNAKNLCEEFSSRGHIVYMVSPNRIISSSTGIRFQRVYQYKKEGSLINLGETNLKNLELDLFYVNDFGEDSENESIPKEFLKNRIFAIEKEVGQMINSAKTTNYFLKSNQKKLDLPFIPGFKIKNKGDLEDLIKDKEKIIAKPIVGCQSKGIYYIDSFNSIEEFLDRNKIEEYIFERYIPSEREKRYIVLDGEIILVREKKLIGPPGKQEVEKAFFGKKNKKELDIVYEAIEKTKIFYGSIDFREEHILEINGSGTSTNPPGNIYNIGGLVVKAIEQKIENG